VFPEADEVQTESLKIILPTECIYGFHIILRIISNYFAKQH
jgi:hypothetical protein